MAHWKENSDLTEPSENDGRPLLGVSHLGLDDEMVLAFEDDGEQVETKYGDAVRFDAELVRTDGHPVDGDGEEIPEGADVTLMTDSARLLKWLAEMDLAGSTFKIVREGTGYDTAYTVVEA